MISTLLTPVLLDRLGPGWAFGVPGVLMVLATICFWMGRDKFVHIPPAGGRFFTETFSRDGLRALANLAPLYFIFIAMFWALFDQTASAWVLQAEQMDRNVFGYELLSSQLQAVNPLLVMAMIPLFSYGLYPWLGRFFDVTPLRKIGIGLFVMVLGFAIPAWIQMQLDVGERPHIIWQVAAYLLLTASEVLVSITALEFSYTQAPNRLKSLMVGGFYLLSVTIGNKFVAEINRFIGEQKQQGASYLDGANYYWFFTACMLGTAVMYLLWSQFYRGQTFIQGDEPADPARVTGEP
jgi:POT family proton-dependent oligopeptide transporter